MNDFIFPLHRPAVAMHESALPGTEQEHLCVFGAEGQVDGAECATPTRSQLVKQQHVAG